jgi:uncharacterized membrane protein YcgQ (UPF0703/DUF1980 family)
MNRIIIAAVIIAISAPIFTVSCDKAASAKPTEKAIANPESNKDIIEIKEKMFIAQVNDVYLNSEDYLEKTIKLEGLFKLEQYYDRDEPYCFVIRYGPGCCGYDGNAGFEVAWEGDRKKPYPDVDSWVEATGILKTYEEDFMEYLYLDLSSLTVLNKRGAEFVQQ